MTFDFIKNPLKFYQKYQGFQNFLSQYDQFSRKCPGLMVHNLHATDLASLAGLRKITN
jgi:hypothetical protein